MQSWHGAQRSSNLTQVFHEGNMNELLSTLLQLIEQDPELKDVDASEVEDKHVERFMERLQHEVNQDSN